MFKHMPRPGLIIVFLTAHTDASINKRFQFKVSSGAIFASAAPSDPRNLELIADNSSHRLLIMPNGGFSVQKVSSQRIEICWGITFLSLWTICSFLFVNDDEIKGIKFLIIVNLSSLMFQLKFNYILSRVIGNRCEIHKGSSYLPNKLDQKFISRQIEIAWVFFALCRIMSGAKTTTQHKQSRQETKKSHRE